MPLDALDLAAGSKRIWPDLMPAVSGAILCYDATRRDTFRRIFEALGE